MRKTVRRILAASTAAAMLCTSAAAAFTDVADANLADAAETLSVVGILDGMGDGAFRPDDYVTREQFAKIAVCILGRRESAAASSMATAFTDVAPDSWARGYISYVAETGIIAGFPDGSFGGGNIITYAQAAAVLMRCMGYTDEDIGFHWPSDYVNKAEALELNRGLALTADDNVTRGQLAIMINNALFTEMKDSEDMLVTKTGVTVYDDTLLYGLNRSDSAYAETGAGSFKIAASALGVDGNYGKTGRLFVNKDKEIILFRAGGDDGEMVIVTSCLNNAEKKTVDIGFDDGTLSLPYSVTVFSDGEKTTAEAVADSITTGSKLKLFRDATGGYLSAVLDIYTMDGPFTITSNNSQIYTLFDIPSTPTVIRGGIRANYDDISLYDIVYYDENTNTVYAYYDKVNGIYEKAEPIKSSVSSVTVSGKTYKIASTRAMNKLNESAGAFAIGDFVTLLLDRNGAVADAVDTSASVGRNLGVLLDSYSRIDDNGNQGYAVKMFLPDGSTMEYSADRNYQDYKGNLMEISFDGGKASLKSVRYVSKGGVINKELMSFDNNWLSSDCSVLVLADNPDNGPAVVRKIRFGDIDGTSLSKQQVIHVEYSGEMNDISLLYLQNATKVDYEYGIITGTDVLIERDEDGNVVRRRTSGSYSIMIHGEEKSINAGRRVFATPVIGISSVNGADYVDAILMGSGRKISAVSGERIKVDNTVYKAADSFDIYRRITPNEYALISVEEAMKLPNSVVEVYGDASVKDGGKVRLVLIR